jgi:hypothetical protein
MAALPPSPAGLSGGDTPGSNPLTIGGVQFNSIECPDKLPIGATEQKLATIELLGGGRNVQTLGVQPKPVEFEGTFYGDTEDRVQQLRSYVVSGQQQSLTWRSESWTCVVKDFSPSYRGSQWVCDYKITLEIVSGGALTSTSFPTVNSQVDGNNQQIQSQLDSIAAQVAADAFAPVNVAWQEYLAILGILFEAEQVYQ